MCGGLPSSRIEIDHEGDAAGYEADEQVQAGYAMAELFVGNRFMVQEEYYRWWATFGVKMNF